MSDPVLVTKHDGVVKITLNRPDAFNAFNMELCEQMASAVEQCTNEDVRAVILTGAGRAFSGGGDMRAALDYMGSGGDPGRFFRDLIAPAHRAMTDIRLLQKPVIASINGTAAGAGFSLAMICDLRICAASVKFKQAYTSMALVPDCGWTATVPALLGLSKASELLLLDPVLDAQQALDLGIVNRVVPDEQLADEAMALAQQLASGPTKAFGAAKSLINSSLLPTLEAQLERERQTLSACAKTEDFRRAVEAFVEKRKPAFTGR